jgi:hypothetical protein
MLRIQGLSARRSDLEVHVSAGRPTTVTGPAHDLPFLNLVTGSNGRH